LPQVKLVPFGNQFGCGVDYQDSQGEVIVRRYLWIRSKNPSVARVLSVAIVAGSAIQLLFAAMSVIP
jgi:hypothetical protein